MPYKYNPLYRKHFDYYRVPTENDVLVVDSIIIKGNDGITYEDTYWDDLRFPFIGQRIDSSSGRIDYDYEEVGIGFQNNARYPDEPVCMVVQLSHSWKIGSPISPHIHYVQGEDATPNWLMQYRFYENNQEVPSEWNFSTGNNIFTYPGSGYILQMYEFPNINLSSVTSVSAFIDIKIFRDTGNDSGLFADTDPYTVTALVKEFDIHYQINSPGSRDEYIK